MTIPPETLVRHIPIVRDCARPYQAICIASAVALTMAECLADSAHTPFRICEAVVLAALTVGMYRWTGFCGACIVLVSAVSTLLPGMAFSPQLWAHWLTYGMLAFQRRRSLVVVLLLCDCLVFPVAWLMNVPTWEPGGIVTLLASFAVACAVGYALAEHRRIRMENEELHNVRRHKLERDRLRRDVTLASRIHDSTARGLTLIALTAEEGHDDMTAGEGHAARLRDIRAIASATLAQVRDVIDVLEGAEPSYRLDAYGYAGTLTEALRQQLRDNDRVLASLGFHGISTLDDETEAASARMDKERVEAMHDCIDHMYTNIAVHAAAGDDAYVVHVRISESGIGIVQFNACGAHAEASHGSGRGLALHQRRMRSFGGTLDCSVRDGIWILRMHMPW